MINDYMRGPLLVMKLPNKFLGPWVALIKV